MVTATLLKSCSGLKQEVVWVTLIAGGVCKFTGFFLLSLLCVCETWAGQRTAVVQGGWSSDILGAGAFTSEMFLEFCTL